MSYNKLKNENILFIFYIVTFAFLLRALIAIGYFNSFDTYWYRDWAVDLPNGLFSVYGRSGPIKLDYPPLYLLFLYPIGLVYKAFGTDINTLTQMAILKFWPVVFDCLTVIGLYLFIKPKGEQKAIICAATWALNPALILNCSLWGQTDSVMIFCLFISFWALYKKRPYLACVLFAASGMMKYQSLFFTPVFLFYLWFETSSHKVFFKGILCAASTVAVVFLPFMIGSKKPLLFFDVYLNGAGTYKYCTLNACNFYALFGLNFKSDQNILGTFGIILVILCVIGIFFLFKKANNRCAFAGAFLIMQCVFMFATRMHERYQITALIFPLLCFAVQNNRKFLWAYFWVTAVSFFNQALFFIDQQNPNNPVFTHYNFMLKSLCVVNILLFIYSVYITVNLFLEKKEELPQNVTSV